MPTITFQPSAISVTVEPNTKVLVAATKKKVPLRFGCAACRCGTCAVAVSLAGEGAALSPLKPEETALLQRIGLPLDGSVRLACQARILSGDATIDVSFQDSYSPDEGASE